MSLTDAELRAQLALPLSADGARVLEVLSSIIEPLAASLPTNTEVVLHELGRLPNSVVAIAGDVTGRRVGDPATDLLLEQLRNVDRERHRIGYHNVLPDGRQLRSTTMIISDNLGRPVAALCINSDVSPWLAARSLIDGMVAGGSRVVSSSTMAQSEPPAPAPRTAAELDLPTSPVRAATTSEEIFPHSVDELVSHLIDDTIRQVGVPVELMKKSHKLAVVDQLEKRGLFLLRDAVETIAVALGVSRFTIYNYLNELDSGGKREE